MEESELMKERLQAITEKHRIQEVIRQKKQELDQEKLKLKQLKKKSLREQWLMDSSYHPPGSTASEQQTRALLLNIYRMEKEIEALEREEAIVSKNESFILERLKVVERSTEDIIKEVNDNFVSAPSPVAMETPDFPQSYSPTTNDLLEPERKTLFAMEINVNRNRRTGERTVLSTSSISPEDLEETPGLKVYDDGRKCVYALHSLEGSDDQSSASELSASEVEQLLKSATVHRQLSQGTTKGRSYCPDFTQHLHLQHYNHSQDEELRWRPSQHKRTGRDIQRVTSFKLPNNNNNRYASQNLRRHQSFHSNGYSAHRNNHANHANHANSANHINYTNHGNHMNYDHHANHANHANDANYANEANHANHRLHYTPANHIPLSHYISVEEDEDFGISPAPSPVYGEDTPFTILSAMETGEPITAIFMGFQPARDDRGPEGEENQGELKAELVIIDEDYGKERKKEEEEREEERIPSRGGGGEVEMRSSL